MPNYIVQIALQFDEISGELYAEVPIVAPDEDAAEIAADVWVNSVSIMEVLEKIHFGDIHTSWGTGIEEVKDA